MVLDRCPRQDHSEIGGQRHRACDRFVNVFFSKRERVYRFNNLKHIQIILNGEVKGANDTTRYHLKFTMETGESFLFGQTLTLEKILNKVRIEIG